MKYFKNQEVKVGDYIFPSDDPYDRYKVVYVKNSHSVVIETRDDQIIRGWHASNEDIEATDHMLKKDGRYWMVMFWNKANSSIVLKNE